MATGGVIIDIMPKYITNRWAERSGTPSSMIAGATSVASRM